MRIHLAGLKETGHLGADLHWSNVRDASNGFLASGGAKPVGKEGGRFDFEIRVRATNGLRFVNGIIFLSPTGNWPDHTFAAATELIPVADGDDGIESTLVRLPIHPLGAEGGRTNVRPTAIPRWMTGLMLLAASAVAWMTLPSISGGREYSSREHRWWQALAAVLALSCIWELFGLENWLGIQARVWARAEDVYYSRALFQKGIISVTIAATLVFLGFVWRKPGPFLPSLLFLGLYLALSIVNLLSLHSIDRYAGLSWHGITLMAALKFACGAATLTGVCQQSNEMRSAKAKIQTPRS